MTKGDLETARAGTDEAQGGEDSRVQGEFGSRKRLLLFLLASLAFTYVFFIEFLPPVRAVHLTYDLDGYHYTLAAYAFHALHHGRFPQWDPTQYCGMPFAADIQAALFYPPLWLLFLACWRYARLPFLGLEILTLAHVFAAFVLCYFWLAAKRLAPLSALFGAGVFAFSGYLLLQLQHFGLVCGYAWLPLGLQGIDQCVQQRRWRPLWRLTAASALCFLSGYTPFWVVFAVVMLAYSLAGPWRAKAAAGSLAALAFSLALSLVQLLPSLEANQLKVAQISYGAGIREPLFYLSYLLPNYFNFSLRADVHTNPGKEYLYLGAPAIFGFLCLLRRRNFSTLLPSLAIAAVSLVFVTNPYDLVWNLIRHSAFLSHIVRSYYFLSGLTLAAAPLAAYGLDDFLKRSARPVPRWFALVSLAALLLWPARLLWTWLPSGPDFSFGPRSLLDPAVMLALFAAGLYAFRGQREALRASLAAALILAIGADYKVFGTSRRFNTSPGPTTTYDLSDFPALAPSIYDQLTGHPTFRLALDPQGGPSYDNLRFSRLSTPLGMDPFLTRRYLELMKRIGQYIPLWSFDLDPSREDSLRILGVRYFVTSEGGSKFAALSANPRFHLLQPSTDYYKVFEYADAQPGYGLDSPDPAASVVSNEWRPERRSFTIRTARAADFHLSEQRFPGWSATIDGNAAPIVPWNGAFQLIRVPAGVHRVEFRFLSRSLLIGAVLSVFFAALFAALISGFRPALSRFLQHGSEPRPEV